VHKLRVLRVLRGVRVLRAQAAGMREHTMRVLLPLGCCVDELALRGVLRG